ncbi:MAG: nucleoid-associated protein, partial [Haemophilus paraphrohaemolyticus]|uniref:nucleoid-associated protein n=1 Tax=Haemophilus paraphrohaemolyticus TaxID=736 RepID=UPI001ECE5AA0
MSINLEEIVLHQIQHHVERENVELKTVLREELLPISPAAEQMMLQLHQAYQSKAKGYGVFKRESVFAQQLIRFLEKETDFLAFSHQSANKLATELAKYPFAS